MSSSLSTSPKLWVPMSLGILALMVTVGVLMPDDDEPSLHERTFGNLIIHIDDIEWEPTDAGSRISMRAVLENKSDADAYVYDVIDSFGLGTRVRADLYPVEVPSGLSEGVLAPLEKHELTIAGNFPPGECPNRLFFETQSGFNHREGDIPLSIKDCQ